MIAGDKAGFKRKLNKEKLGVQCFIRDQMFLQFRHLKIALTWKSKKQEQDTDMNVIDTDCSGSRADASSYFCSEGHRRTFMFFYFSPFSFKPALHCVSKQQK